MLYAFDLIEHDGEDLRGLPFLDRKPRWQGFCGLPRWESWSMSTSRRTARQCSSTLPAWCRGHRVEADRRHLSISQHRGAAQSGGAAVACLDVISVDY
jgi:hypothetical protein